METRALARAALAFASLAATLPGQTIDPTSCDLLLDPGETDEVSIEVCIPGEEVTKADIYLLADNTESMGAVIDAVSQSAAGLASTLLSRQDFDLRIGVGNYNDIPPLEQSPFFHQLAVTDDEQAIVGAIQTWTNSLGGDVSESQFYALHRIATDPVIGFRPDAKRIVVWFGDSPAHDPICADIVGLFEAPVEVNEASVIAELQGAGPFGGTTVIAISTPFSQQVPDGLNNDPLGPGGILAQDYTLLLCPQTGTAGQADRIAAATGGISTGITDPAQITGVILDTIDSVLTEAIVTTTAVGDIVPFVTSIDPEEIAVPLPNDARAEACVDVVVAFEGTPCEENQPQVFEGGIEVRVNGMLVGTKDVTIQQTGCEESVCVMWAGLVPIAQPIGIGGVGDVLYTVPIATWPVLMDDVPVFAIPDDPALDGAVIYFQVLMNNAVDFPFDPVKTSNGLAVTLGQGAEIVGGPSGMTLFLQQPPLLGGLLEPAFTIDGF